MSIDLAHCTAARRSVIVGDRFARCAQAGVMPGGPVLKLAAHRAAETLRIAK